MTTHTTFKTAQVRRNRYLIGTSDFTTNIFRGEERWWFKGNYITSTGNAVPYTSVIYLGDRIPRLLDSPFNEFE